jgi:hypothetical protein
MIRFSVLALCAAACGRSHGVSDQDLTGLVVEARKPEAPIDVARAARDPGELGRALARPYRVMLAALGPHSVSVNSAITVHEAGQQVSDLSDHAQIDNGTAGSYHAIYTNSADYGRETTFSDGRLYLRPRYQRWHARAPEAPDEPAELRDRYFDAIAATWDLLAPAAELADRGALEVAGRPGRKIEIVRSSDPRDPVPEAIAQRKWREARSIDELGGEVVLDAERGVPLAVKLTGKVGFVRDGRKFAMAVSVDSAISGLGTAAVILPPPEGEIVATPERRREVDDRDYLLQGIAPPLRRNPDGTAIPPTPRLRGEPARPDAAGPAKPADKPSKADAAGKAAKTSKSGDSAGKARSGDADDKQSTPSRKPRGEDAAPRRAKPEDGAKP